MALNSSAPRQVPPPLPPRPSSNSSTAPDSLPPPLPQRPSRAPSPDLHPPNPLPDEEEQELTEEQLRLLYDEEEIERFLSFFSSYVNEVRAPHPKSKHPVASEPTMDTTTQSSITLDTAPDDQWYDLSTAIEYKNGVPDPNAASICEEQRSVSEIIALDYIRPLLPPDSATPPTFSLPQLRLSVQRLYLATEPIYKPFIEKAIKLSTWQDWNMSARYCMTYWFLWFYNLVLPGAVLFILYALIRRRIFSYPTLLELRERRNQDERASVIGEHIQNKLSSGSILGVRDVWRLIKMSRTDRKAQNGPQPMSSASHKTDESSSVNVQDTDSVYSSDPEGEEEGGVKLGVLGLQVIAMISDNHERLNNLFIWRAPLSSLLYGFFLFGFLLFTIFVPTQYIAKTVLFVGGILYWHITPVLASLPPTDLMRFPPVLRGLPTNADYAMDLISKRVADGLDINPSKSRRARREQRKPISSEQAQTSRAAEGAEVETSVDIDWRKWGERAARSRAWVDEGKRVLTGKMPGRIPASPFSPSLTTNSPHDSHTYPVQRSSAPGLITLTPTTLLFSNIVSSQVKLSIPLAQIQGVKKGGVMGGIMNGLSIKWVTENGEERLEKFHWVGGRDDLFARLIAVNGRQWIQG